MKKIKVHFCFLIFIALLTTVFYGCSKDRDDELLLLGEWVEEAPVENRTEIYFYSASRLTRTTNDTISEDYRYSIVEETIILRPDDESEAGGTELFFRQINENSFQIENLYPSTAEGEVTYMIFRRKSSGASEEN